MTTSSVRPEPPYYADAASMAAWKAHPEHLEAQRLGRARWHSSYSVEVARVEREEQVPPRLPT